MEEKTIPIFGQFFKINETAETIKSKNPKEKNLIKIYSDELNSNPKYIKLKESFEELSKKMIALGLKPKMILNSFLVYKYQTIEEGLELLYRSQEGEWNHKFIESDENLCFICEEQEINHRSINKILNRKSFPRSPSIGIEQDEILKKKISEKEIFLRKSLSNHDKNSQKNSLKVSKRLNSSLDNEQNSPFELLANSNDNIECPICIFEIAKNNLFNSLACNHKFCRDCIKEYLNEEIKNSRVISIKCPNKGCNSLFEEKIIKELINDEIFYKYKKFLQREKYKSIPNIVCCPIINCEGYANKNEKCIKPEKVNTKTSQISINLDYQDRNSLKTVKNDKKPGNITLIEDEQGSEKGLKDNSKNLNNPKKSDENNIRRKLKCNFNHEICSLCISPWHGEEECDEDREIKNFAIASGIIPKKCPKCKVWTEKNLGCNHMTCKICQFNWCWLCSLECLPDHYLQENSICFGKQFDEHSNPNDMFFILLLMNHSIYYISTFFIFYLTIYMIHIVFQNRELLNQNLNNLNNNRNINNFAAEDIENNLNNPLIRYNNNNNHINLLENMQNRNQGNDVEPNNNTPITLGQKVGLFIVGECVLSIFYIILVVTNGFFFIPLLTMLSQISTINNKQAQILCFLTFCLIFFIFFITGILISTLWFILSSVYLIFKIIMF